MHREIEIDEDTDKGLTALAEEYRGDLGLALAELIRVREFLQEFAGEIEGSQEDDLHLIRHRSQEEFREGRTLTWDEVKVRNGL